MDKELYSRQLYVLGKNAMKKITNSVVLLYGLDGLGIEICKNIILGGIKKLIICDPESINYIDLGTNYYINETSLDKNRVTASIKKLQELNPYINIVELSFDKLEDSITEINILVYNNNNIKKAIKLNKITRKKNIKFIMCSSFGVFGQIFCDFGNNFIVEDYDDNDIKQGIIIDIIKKDTTFMIITNDKNFLTQGDTIEIIGKAIKKNKEIIVKNICTFNKFEIDINDLELEGLSFSGISFVQIKKERIINFEQLEYSIKNPKIIHDFALSEKKAKTIHIGYQIINKFYSKYKRYPKRSIKTDLQQFIKLCKTISEIIDEDILKYFCYGIESQLVPINSIIGGIVAQEIMKACSGKFTPIEQWFYYEATDILKNIDHNCKKSIFEKYTNQELIFSDAITEKLEKIKIFIVGAGAIGCEHLKNLSMMGIGNIIITDMDIIEKSNLTRQFLFRDSDIGKSKSQIAVREALKINPNINIISQNYKIGVETNIFYDKKFYSDLTCVMTALDNNISRLFVDSECIKYKIPLLESGTMGTKCSTQIVLPYKTESYGTFIDPPEKSIPICTIKNFPYNINHTISWAIDIFDGLFNKSIINLIKYLENNSFFEELSEKNNIIEDLLNIYKNTPNDYKDCINFSFVMFDYLFNKQIDDLIKKYPENSKDASNVYFWRGDKIFPKLLDFDINNKYHTRFIFNFANIWAQVFGIEIIININLNNFKFINTKQKYDNIEILKKISENDIYKNIKNIEFNRDDNNSINLINAISNLRAENYKINTISTRNTKKIAGNIIPAIATTTALVSGLICIELYKLINNISHLEKFKNSFINLALPIFTSSEPEKVQTKKLGNTIISIWNIIKINNMSLNDFLNYFEEKYALTIINISADIVILYSAFDNNNLDITILDIYEKITGFNLSELIISIIFDSEEIDIINCQII
jgi:ubiquitin-activating enzyme E1